MTRPSTRRNIFFTMLVFVIAFSELNANTDAPNHCVMTEEEFTKTINNDEFLIAEKMTVNDQPLSLYELIAIRNAIRNANTHFGGIFSPGRKIDSFTGDTLVVGGGKNAGLFKQNLGKTVLIDPDSEVYDFQSIIQKLRSGAWSRNPYTGGEFESDAEKEKFISELERKIILYRDVFHEKNNDTLKRYYTINIDEDVQPDILASITSLSDVGRIPDHKFNHVVLENIPCDVYLNQNLYLNLERFTKPGGTITFAIGYDCHRLIIPVIKRTKFGEEFIKKIKMEMYPKVNKMCQRFDFCYIKITNN